MYASYSSSMPPKNADVFLTLNEVMQRINVGKTFIYKMIKRGMFPPPAKLGPRSVRWFERDVINWMESRRKIQRAA